MFGFNNFTMITQKVCGGIIYRTTERGIQYLILKRAKYHNGVKTIEGHWTIPKALKKELQSDEACALSQVKTESGLDVEFKKNLGQGRPYTFYWNGQRIKRENHYLLFQANGTTLTLQENTSDYHWGELSDVKRKMNFQSATKMFEHAEKIIKELNAQPSTQPSAEDKNNS